MKQGMHLWKPERRLDTGINAAEKIFTPADVLGLVPSIGLVEIGGRLRCDDQISGHGGCEFGA